MTRFVNIMFIFLGMVLLQCATHKVTTPPAPSDATLKAMPEWYVHLPSDSNFIFSAASATSRDMDLATRKATQQARAEIARQIETRLQGLVKNFAEEVGSDNQAEFLAQFTEVNKAVTDQVLNGSQVIQKKIVRDGPLYRAYVLMKMPVGEANKAFVEQVKQRHHLHTRLRASQAFKELEAAINQSSTK